jgi:hypothetical protein
MIRNVSWGDFEEAKREAAEILKVAGSKPGKVLILVDLIQSGKASSGARKVYSGLLKSEKFCQGGIFWYKDTDESDGLVYHELCRCEK